MGRSRRRYTGTSIELASPDTSRAVIVLLVSMPSVSTMIALCVADRAASRRAVAAVASYREVVPKGSNSDKRALAAWRDRA